MLHMAPWLRETTIKLIFKGLVETVPVVRLERRSDTARYRTYGNVLGYLNRGIHTASGNRTSNVAGIEYRARLERNDPAKLPQVASRCRDDLLVNGVAF